MAEGQMLRGGRPRSTPLPRGNLALLFTDMEGSTRLLHQLGDSFAALLGDHHRIMRAAIGAHVGVEVGTSGDSFFAVFHDPADAVATACEAQQRLVAHAWPQGVEVRIRMGLHCGEAIVSDDDYVGMDVHRAARIASATHGAQVLLSAEMVEAVRDRLPPGVRVRDLGAHSLKDLPQPERLFQLVVPGLPVHFPPPRAHKPPAAAAGLPDYSLPPADVPCPYKGLSSFDAGDADLFFGREHLIDQLMTKLRDFPFVAVIGPSGSGKSSLVRAGLLPALENADGGAPVRRALLTPGEHPVRALERAIGTGTGGEVVLVVDQFEEVFTHCRVPDERSTFVATLLRAMYRPGVRAVVVCLRADFYGHCAAHPDLAAALQDHQLLVGPMSEEEVTRAIEEPARRVGLALEPGLSAAVVRDVGSAPGALPLLSHALLETWRRRSAALLTLIGYLHSGGVHEAVARTAEAVYLDELDPHEQRIARSIFLRLSALGEGTDDTRRRVERAELVGRDDDAVVAEAVVAKLVSARILTADDRTVEVAHEALIRHWPRLRSWLNEDREGLRVHRHLTEAAGEWLARGRDSSSLYRGGRLAAAQERAESSPLDINDLEREFLAASRDAERSEVETIRRRHRRVRALAGALGLLLIATVALVVVAARQTSRARDEGRASLSRALGAQSLGLLDTRPDQALLLGLEAYRRAPTPEAHSALLAAVQRTRRFTGMLTGVHERVTAVAASPDGRVVATGGPDGTIALWSASDRRRIRPPLRAGSEIRTLAFGRAGTLLAVGTSGGPIELVDVRAGRRVAVLDGHRADVDGLAFSVSGKWLTSVSSFEGSARRWEVASRVTRLQVHFDSYADGAVAVSDDGALVATQSQDGRVHVRHLATGRTLSTLAGAGREVTALRFGPRARVIAGGDARGRVRIWSVGTGRVTTTARVRHRAPVRALDFSRDGRALASAGAEGDVVIADPAARAERLAGHAGGGTGVAFASAGDFVATAGEDGAVILWGTRDDRGLERSAAIPRGALSSDLAAGGRLVTLAYRRHVDVRRVADGRSVVSIRGLAASLAGVAVDRDGRVLATADKRGAVQLWDVPSGRRRGPPLRGYSENFDGVAFSPDGELVVAWSGNLSLTLWDLRQRRTRGAVAATDVGVLSDVAFSPDGSLIAVSGSRGTVELFATRGLRPIDRQLTGHSDGVTSIAFSPDGAILASGSEDGTVRLWDVRARRALRSAFAASEARVTDVAISPDGGVLAVAAGGAVGFWSVASPRLLGARLKIASEEAVGEFTADDRDFVGFGDGRATVWEPTLWSGDSERLAERVCRLVGRGLTRSEWGRFVPAEAYRATCA